MKYQIELHCKDKEGKVQVKTVSVVGISERDVNLIAHFNQEIAEKEYGKGNVTAYIEEV